MKSLTYVYFRSSNRNLPQHSTEIKLPESKDMLEGTLNIYTTIPCSSSSTQSVDPFSVGSPKCGMIIPKSLKALGKLIEMNPGERENRGGGEESRSRKYTHDHNYLRRKKTKGKKGKKKK